MAKEVPALFSGEIGNNAADADSPPNSWRHRQLDAGNIWHTSVHGGATKQLNHWF
jgi:hypothetical protein